MTTDLPCVVTSRRATRFRSGRAAALALLALAGAAFGGCSFLFVDGPPANHQSLAYFDCSSSRLAPVTDLVLAGLEGLGTYATYSNGNSGLGSDSDVIVPALVAALFAASGVVGLQRVSKCDEAKSLLMMRSLESTRRSPPPPFRPAADPWLAPPPALGGAWREPAAPADNQHSPPPPSPAPIPTPTPTPSAPSPTPAP
jgi:hypothetical protein